MSNENVEDSVMEDAQASQNGEQAVDDIELDENKLFLVRLIDTPLWRKIKSDEFHVIASGLHANGSFL